MWQDAPPAEVRDCGSSLGLYARLEQLAQVQPKIALACATALGTEAQRDSIQRLAFSSAVSAGNPIARTYAQQFESKRWVADGGFFPTLRLALATESRTLILAAIRSNPALGVRDCSSYLTSRYGREAFDEAAALAPSDAAILASGATETSKRVRAALQTSDKPEVRELAVIGSDESLRSLERERVPMFYREIANGRTSLARAKSLTTDAVFFREAVRLDQTDFQIRTAKSMLIAARPGIPSLPGYSVPEKLLFAASGRGEITGEQFRALVGGTVPLELPTQLHRRLLDFLALASDFGVKVPATWIETGLDRVQSIADAIAIADIVPDTGAIRSRIEALHAARPADRVVFGLLAAHIAHSGWDLAGRYTQAYRPTEFDPGRNIVERYFFYNDEDGIESYRSFLGEYQHDANWTIELRGDYVHIASKDAARRVEIYANLPGRDAQPAISRLFDERHIEPEIFVHRGHDTYVHESLPYLNASAKLVYLGSCYGLDITAEALGRARQAQIIATRGIGTMGVNDPILKRLNDELLTTPGPISWPVFWKSMETRIGGSALFRDYVRPDRNVPAAMMAAYYAALTSGD